MPPLRTLLLIFALLAFSRPALSQPPPPLKFEVATIKPVAPDGPHANSLQVYPGGRVVIQDVGLKGLVHMAFDVDFWQISDAAGPSVQGGYDIVAKAPETTPPANYSLRHSLFEMDDPRLRQMLQALLIDRFQLKFHRKTEDGPVLLLVRSGKPIPLHPTKVVDGKNAYGEGFDQVGWAGDWNMYNTTMPELAKFASGYVLHHPVIDKTELEGSFDYRSKLSQTANSEQNGDADSFRVFLQEIGLKLVPSSGPVETLVIDSVQPPSPN